MKSFFSGKMLVCLTSTSPLKIDCVSSFLASSSLELTFQPYSTSMTPAQPIGLASGKQCALKRIEVLENSQSLPADTVIISLENYLDLETKLDHCYAVIKTENKLREGISFGVPVKEEIISALQKENQLTFEDGRTGYAKTGGELYVELGLSTSANNWMFEVEGIHRLHQMSDALAKC